MSKRSRAQREIERANRERLAMAQADPSKVDFPDSCSDSPCHRKTSIAVITRVVTKAGIRYMGWSACSIHIPKLVEIFKALEANLELAKSGLQKIQDSGLVIPTGALAQAGDAPLITAP